MQQQSFSKCLLAAIYNWQKLKNMVALKYMNK